MDLTLIIYLIITLVSLYGFAIFGYWWWYKGSASRMYVYITFLFLGLFFNYAGVSYVRYLFNSNIIARDDALYSWWWLSRSWLVLVIIMLITGQMTYRMFITKNKG